MKHIDDEGLIAHLLARADKVESFQIGDQKGEHIRTGDEKSTAHLLRCAAERIATEGKEPEKIIELAGRILKVIRLAGQPGMDAVAIKLNCDLTHGEEREAKAWYRAFQLAWTGTPLFELAQKLNEEFKR